MADRIEELEAKLKEAMIGVPLTAEQADALGLVTMILDDIDWDDELEAKLKEAMGLLGIIF
jgi:benzoyl-CoA-dihydrodiol lyase